MSKHKKVLAKRTAYRKELLAVSISNRKEVLAAAKFQGKWPQVAARRCRRAGAIRSSCAYFNKSYSWNSCHWYSRQLFLTQRCYVILIISLQLTAKFVFYIESLDTQKALCLNLRGFVSPSLGCRIKHKNLFLRNGHLTSKNFLRFQFLTAKKLSSCACWILAQITCKWPQDVVGLRTQ